MKNFIFFFFVFIPFALTGQRNVSGKIISAEDKAPVVGASVFISNTTIGALTDAEGRYQLKIPEDGSYVLTVSYMGYQSVFKDIEPGKTPVEFNATLRIQEKELEEVAVVAKVRFRQRDIDLFWRTILGKSPSRNAIWVANPEAVYYYYNPETRILKVTCREPLQIFNYETGYQIHYVLNYFTYDYNKNSMDWSNQFVFSQLVPENLKQENKWEKKRREVYNTSLTKFIKSLYNNTLYDDGFVLATLRQNREPNNPYQISLLDPEIILSQKSADNSRTFDLSNGQVMLVCYGRTVNANDLDIIQHPQNKEFLKKSGGLLMNLLQGESIRIFQDGTYANKLLMAPVNSSNTLLGLNMRLPFEYRPEEQTPPVAKNEDLFNIDSINRHFNTQMEVYPQEKLHLHTDRNRYVPGEKIRFKAYLTDAATFQPSTQSRYVYAELIDSRDSLVNRVMIRPDSDNMFHGHILISENVQGGKYTLRAYTRHMENLGDDYFFKKIIYIENPASGKNSPSIDGKGNRSVQSEPLACALTVTHPNGIFKVGVQKSAGDKNNSCYLLGQCRGQVFYFGIPDKDSDAVDFSEADLPAGVLQFVLFDDKMNPLSERLTFNKNQEKAKVEFQTDKALYNKREKVIATISLTDSAGNPLAGNLSVAVTDDKDIAVDSTTTIQSSLLLSSELKGYTDNAAYYLQDNSESAAALDHLMLTHEWKRYNVPEVVKGNYESPQIPFQTSQEISGRVSGENNSKPVAGGELSFIVKGGGYGLTATDKKGAFTFQDFEYPDSTSYFIQALGKKENDQVKLVINEESFPKPIHAPQSSAAEIPVNKGDPNDAFILKAEQRSKYGEDMQAVQLNDIAVTGRKLENKDEPRLKFWANAGSDATIRRKDIEKLHPQAISDILSTIPGVRVYNGVVSIRESMSIYSGTAPLVLLNGVIVGEADGTSNSPLQQINVSDVESIDVFMGASSSAFGVRGANGVISVTTGEGINDIRKGKNANESKALNQAIYTPLGYQKPEEFYSPNYETLVSKQSTTPDYRTTIFWKPDIVTSNTGEAVFEFYTSDFPTTYSVVIEGLTNDGKIVRQVEKIRVK